MELQLHSGLFKPPQEPGMVLFFIKKLTPISNNAGKIRMNANKIVFIIYKLQA